jgi:ribosomal protein S18 acetylase RimI-like enzyme
MHVLDNAIWHALTGPHATLAEQGPHAARYQPDVSVFGAVDDDASPEAWDELAGLIGPGGGVVVSRTDLNAPEGRTIPEGWSTFRHMACRQMWLLGELRPDPRTAALDAELDVVTLAARDVPDMLALVGRTKPGPFVTRTIELGTYIGVREGGELVAMAGERMHPTGFTEISAVCTDESQRGRGLAAHLVRVIVAGIRGRSETPFLHLTIENEPAYRLYDALGFETRSLPDVIGIRAPGQP